MQQNRFLWYWIAADPDRSIFLARLGVAAGAMLVLALVGWVAPRARLWMSALAYLLMPVVGAASPMERDHLGDRTWEMFRYTKGTYQWKAGELLGTWPFYELGNRFAAVHDVDGRRLALSLATTGVLGALGFALLSVEMASVQAGAAAGGGWVRRARAVVATDMGYLRMLAFATLPCFLVYAGFIQTTYVSDLVLPWALLLTMRAFRPDPPIVTRRGFVRRASVIAGAWLALAVVYIAHGAAIVLLLGAIGASLLRLAATAVRELRGQPPSARALLVEGWRAGFGLAVLLSLGPFTNAMTAAYPKVFRDPWVPAGGTVSSRLLAMRAITHAVPRWVPLLGQQHPTCGQQTWLFSPMWLRFTASTLLHVTPILPWLALLVWAAFSSRSAAGLARGGLEVRAWLDGLRQVPAPLLGAALASLAFMALYSPHFSEPRDVDVIYVPATVCSICVIEALTRTLGRTPTRRPSVAWMVALVASQGLLLCASWGVQPLVTTVPLIRGISQPWC